MIFVFVFLLTAVSTAFMCKFMNSKARPHTDRGHRRRRDRYLDDEATSTHSDNFSPPRNLYRKPTARASNMKQGPRVSESSEGGALYIDYDRSSDLKMPLL